MALPQFPFDHHIHTIFSGHSSMDMLVANIIRRADELGLARIVIVEHIPAVEPSVQAAVLDKRFDRRRSPRACLDSILEEREIWRGECRVEVLVGAEIDADPHAMDGSLLLEDLSGLDLVLASTHYMPGAHGLWYDGTEWPPEKRESFYREWFVWAMHIAANPLVDVIAHPGALLCANGIIERFEGAALEDYEKLLQVCQRYGTAFELNELMRKKISPAQAESYHRVIGKARELGVPISIASDAHQLSHVGRYDWVVSVAKAAGLTEEDLYRPRRRTAAADA